MAAIFFKHFWSRIPTKVRWAAIAYFLFDTFRYIRYRLRLSRINSSPGPAFPTSTKLDPKSHTKYIMRLLLDEPNIIAHIRGCFRDRQLSEIPRQAVYASLLFYISMKEQCNAPEVHDLANIVLKNWEERTPELSQLSETLWNGGTDYYSRPEIDFIRIGQSDITPWFKPFVVRVSVFLYRWYQVHYKLRMYGFEHEIYLPSGVTFWTRHGTIDTPPQPPLFLFHGMGLGSAPYITIFLREFVVRFPNRTIVVAEWPNLGHGMFRFRYPNTSQLVNALHNHLLHCWDRLEEQRGCSQMNGFVERQYSKLERTADVVGHSYGSSVISYWLREYPDDLRKRVSMDPISTGVTFGMMSGYGFERRLSSVYDMFCGADSYKELLIEYVIKGDIDTQQYAKRECWLFELWDTRENGWDENSMVVLSENDKYVNAHGVSTNFDKWKFQSKVVVVKEWKHGDCCLGADKYGVWEKVAKFVSGVDEHAVRVKHGQRLEARRFSDILTDIRLEGVVHGAPTRPPIIQTRN
jgi:pimeloyl-ACP methyl ester carboxylesterase